MWLLALLIVPTLRRARNRMFRVFTATLAGTALLMTVLVGTVGGSDFRYTLDYYPMFILAGVLLALEAYKYLQGKFSRRLMRRLFVAAAAATCFISVMLVIRGDEGCWLEINSPDVFYALKRTFEFWI